MKNGKVYMKHNSLGDDVPIVVILRAMGATSDQEIVQLVGSEPEIMNAFMASLEDSQSVGVYTQKQALLYIGTKMR
ncbi:unnamed protein product, partial [Ectocarpus sp. 8 AP-2014]